MPTMQIDAIEKLRAAAAKRTEARSRLEDPKLTDKDRERIQGEILRANRAIDRAADRINGDLRKAAESGVRVKRPAGLGSIQDSSLTQYCNSVRSAIDRLNGTIAAGKGNASLQLRRIRKQKEQAKQLEASSKKSQATIGVESDKLTRREKEAKGRLAQASAQLDKISKELARREDEKKRLDEQRYALDRLESAGQKLTPAQLTHKAKIAELNLRVIDELRRLRLAQRNAKEVAGRIKSEIADLQGAQKLVAAAGEKEKDRRKTIAQNLAQLSGAEKKAARAGVAADA